MYEDGIDVTYRTLDDDEETRSGWSELSTVHLPGWAAGDPQMAVALYLFGHRNDVDLVEVEDWQPTRDWEREDADAEAEAFTEEEIREYEARQEVSE